MEFDMLCFDLLIFLICYDRFDISALPLFSVASEFSNAFGCQYASCMAWGMVCHFLEKLHLAR
jgi:hypothetical protein